MDLMTAMLLASSGPDPNGANNSSTIPATAQMTSNTTPSGAVTSTGNSYESTANAWIWFDRNLGSRYMFMTSNLPCSVTYQFPLPVQINKMGLAPTFDYTKRSPGAFSVYGSVDGSSWTLLSSPNSLVESSYAIGSYTWFTWSNSNSYLYYKLTITLGVPTSDGYLGLDEVCFVVAT